MIGVLFSLPNTSEIFTNISSYAQPVFSDFQPIIWLIAGFGVFIFLAGLILFLVRR